MQINGESGENNLKEFEKISESVEKCVRIFLKLKKERESYIEYIIKYQKFHNFDVQEFQRNNNLNNIVTKLNLNLKNEANLLRIIDNNFLETKNILESKRVFFKESKNKELIKSIKYLLEIFNLYEIGIKMALLRQNAQKDFLDNILENKAKFLSNYRNKKKFNLFEKYVAKEKKIFDKIIYKSMEPTKMEEFFVGLKEILNPGVRGSIMLSILGYTAENYLRSKGYGDFDFSMYYSIMAIMATYSLFERLKNVHKELISAQEYDIIHKGIR